MPDTIPAFEWKQIEQHHYECRWNGFLLTANPDAWKVECSYFIRLGAPRTVAGVRISAATRATVARANAEAAAYRQFMRKGKSNE